MRWDLAISDFFYEVLEHYFKDSLSEKLQKRIASFLEHTIYFIAIVGPIMTLPQIYKIWATQSAMGLSIITWSSYLVIAFLWLMFGIFTKNRPIIFAHVLWIGVHTTTLVGIYLYG